MCHLKFFSKSEFELYVQLYAARGLGRRGPAEQRGRGCSDIGDVIGVVENVERIQRYADDLRPFLLL